MVVCSEILNIARVFVGTFHPKHPPSFKKNDYQISRKDIVHLVIDSTVSLGLDSSRMKEKTHMTM